MHELLGGGEQAVPPVQRGLQGLPSFGLGTPDPGQSHGVGADLVADLVQPVYAGTGGGELDGERETVEIRADLGGALAHLAGHGEPGHGRAQPRDEQVPSGRVQWRDRVEHLAVEVEGFAAGGEHRDRSARAEHRGHGLRGVGEQVLAVVDDQQHPPPADRGAQGLLGRARRRRRAADRRADDLGDRLPALHRGEVDEPHPVRVRGRRLPGDLDGQAGLPGAGGPRQRDQPMLTQQPGHRGELGRAPDQVGHRGGQVDLVVRGLIPCRGCDGCDVVLQDLPLHLPQLPAAEAERASSVSMAMLVVLERSIGMAPITIIGGGLAGAKRGRRAATCSRARCASWRTAVTSQGQCGPSGSSPTTPTRDGCRLRGGGGGGAGSSETSVAGASFSTAAAGGNGSVVLAWNS